MPRKAKPTLHMEMTERLARALAPRTVYDWLMKEGYYPESYVLPPCFLVEKHPTYGKRFFPLTAAGNFNVSSASLIGIEFPKSNFADRIFGIINPEIYSDIAFEIASNWRKLLKDVFFNKQNLVCSYSFPIPLDSRRLGAIGRLRSGRMIYEFLEMAENDIASEAYQFRFLVIADVKNCYDSIYTHSLSWAVHGRTFMKSRRQWRNFRLCGNRIDRLFQRANSDHTNGIPIGPAVSDVASEALLSRVDIEFSRSLTRDRFLAVRFKDDYRILCKTEEDARSIIKSLQAALKSFNLILSDTKTTYHAVPDGIFRPWASRYHAANPTPKQHYSYKQLKELYLSVLSIERDLPGTGVIDRFLADIVTKDYRPRFSISKKTVAQIISMLLMLPSFRIKSFPRTLGVIESMMRAMNDKWYTNQIGQHLASYLNKLAVNEKENRYLIIWILYFLRSNRLDRFILKKHRFKDPLVRSVQTSRSNVFSACKDFKLLIGIIEASERKSLLEHLDVFAPQ